MGHEDKGHTLWKADWTLERSGSLKPSCQTIPGLSKHSPNGETFPVVARTKAQQSEHDIRGENGWSVGRMAGAWGGECEGLRLGGGQGQAAGAGGPSCLLSANAPVLRRGFHAGHLHLSVKSAEVL